MHTTYLIKLILYINKILSSMGWDILIYNSRLFNIIIEGYDNYNSRRECKGYYTEPDSK